MFKRVYDETLHEEFLFAEINGLPVYVIPKRKFNGKYAIWATKYGSINKKFRFEGKTYDVPLGIAHFLEHKMFEKPYGDAFERYSETGANANAYTSFNMTAYLFSCNDNFAKSLDILLDTVTSPYFTEKTVAKEQGIIGQEIAMMNDNPGNRCFYNLMNCLYHTTPIKYEIAGTAESIMQITPQLLYDCHRAFYSPKNSVLCCCGNIDEDEVAGLVEKYFKNDASPVVEPIFDDEPNEIVKTSATDKMSVALPIFEFGIKDTAGNMTGPELDKHAAAMNMLIRYITSKSGDFYTRLYNNGTINSTFGGGIYRLENLGVFSFSGDAHSPETFYEEIIKEIESLKKNGIDPQNFKRLKNKHYGNLLADFDSVEELANEYANAHFENMNPLLSAQLYREIDLDYLNSKLRYLDTSKMASSIIYNIDKE